MMLRREDILRDLEQMCLDRNDEVRVVQLYSVAPMKLLLFLTFLILSSRIDCGNLTVNPAVASSDNKKTSHFTCSLWPYQMLVGLAGVVLNSHVLRIFITERDTLVTSVNSMIW